MPIKWPTWKKWTDIQNDTLLKTLDNNQVITEEIKGEIKKYLETNDNGDTTTQNLWDAASSAKREVYSNTSLHQETGNI